jgi:hypothetical protein
MEDRAALMPEIEPVPRVVVLAGVLRALDPLHPERSTAEGFAAFRLRCEELTGQTQSPAERLRRFRGIFVDGTGNYDAALDRRAKEIDMLSVTTTMEVGIDIGALQAVYPAPTGNSVKQVLRRIAADGDDNLARGTQQHVANAARLEAGVAGSNMQLAMQASRSIQNALSASSTAKLFRNVASSLIRSLSAAFPRLPHR